jgi:ketosteroid isomerase-like protein
VEIRSQHPEHPAWQTPVTIHFRREGDGSWTLVGVRRLP